MRTYFWLISRDGSGDWTIEFGAKDKQDVVFERDDYRDHGWRLKDLAIHEGPPSDKYIRGYVDKLNKLNAESKAMEELCD